MDFAINAWLRGYGTICLPPQPSMLPDELSTARRNSSGRFFSRGKLHIFGNGSCKLTDMSP